MGYLLYLMVMWLQNGIKWANILSLFGTATFYSQLCSFKSLFKNQLNKSFYYANEPIIRAIFPFLIPTSLFINTFGRCF